MASYAEAGKSVCTELATLMQFRCGLQIIKSLIKLIGLIAVVYILLLLTYTFYFAQNLNLQIKFRNE